MHLFSYSKALLLSALFSVVSFSSVTSMERITANSVSSAEPIQLFNNHKDIFVQDENAAYRVEKHNFNPLLLEVMQRKAMGKFVDAGYIRVSKLDDGKYVLNAQVRGLGGGPATGWCAYWGTKTVGWCSFAAAVWVSSGEALLHTAEAMQVIEFTATAAGILGTAAPTP